MHLPGCRIENLLERSYPIGLNSPPQVLSNPRQSGTSQQSLRRSPMTLNVYGCNIANYVAAYIQMAILLDEHINQLAFENGSRAVHRKWSHYIEFIDIFITGVGHFVNPCARNDIGFGIVFVT